MFEVGEYEIGVEQRKPKTAHTGLRTHLVRGLCTEI